MIEIQKVRVEDASGLVVSHRSFGTSYSVHRVHSLHASAFRFAQSSCSDQLILAIQLIDSGLHGMRELSYYARVIDFFLLGLLAMVTSEWNDLHVSARKLQPIQHYSHVHDHIERLDRRFQKS